MIEGQCYGCFTDATYQYHGASDKYQREIQRYIDGLDEQLKIECVTCSRKIRYAREGGKWHEEETE